MSEYTIKKIVLSVQEMNTILPAIQRKFVWEKEQICRLFDSIMREYPIGEFLIWDVNAETINNKEITFYKFLFNYSKFDRINESITFANDELTNNLYLAILDGQQRIQSLVIGLLGSYTEKKRKGKEFLYLNLLGEPNEEENYKYQFQFMTVEERNKRIKENKNEKWFLVNEVLSLKNSTDISSKLNEYEFENEKDKEFARDMLHQLMHYINESKDVIMYHEIPEDKSIEDVLEMFVRKNNGGTVLSKSDLLFSTIVSKWDGARDTIDDFLKDINNVSNSSRRYRFDIDFIMRTILYILEREIKMNVESFKGIAENIENQWQEIANAIKKTVELLKEIGFFGDNITSNNAIIPIVYYIYNNGKLNKNNKYEIKKYLIVAQLNRIFGAASNTALIETRKKLRKNNNFCLKDFEEITVVGKSFKVDEETVKEWLKYKKGQKYTFMILTLLYPEVDVGEGGIYHEDHLHPDILLKKQGFNSQKDLLGNLQLLKGPENESKGKKELKKWVQEGNDFKYRPKDISLEITDFQNFLNKREELIVERLMNILSMK